jgi:hypothetical protein
VLTGRSRGAALKCSLQCILLAHSNVLAISCTTQCTCLQVGSCLCMGRNVEMWRFIANGQCCAINYRGTSSLSLFGTLCWGSFVGPDFALRGGGCVLQCVRVEYKAGQDLHCCVAAACLFKNRLGMKCHPEPEYLSMGH